MQNYDRVIKEVRVEHISPECIAAKKREMDAFKEFGVYQEVEERGQVRLSLR